jgi:hypothetical protein
VTEFTVVLNVVRAAVTFGCRLCINRRSNKGGPVGSDRDLRFVTESVCCLCKLRLDIKDPHPCLQGHSTTPE